MMTLFGRHHSSQDGALETQLSLPTVTAVACAVIS